MVGAISHDLRTPLARMRFRLERAPAEMKPGMLSDVSQMEEMITSVLLFIRDASEPSIRERVDLRSIVECVVDDAALVGGDAVGPGPPDSEMERVFLPFYRSVSSRTLDKGGIGLGLAVSRSIARAHGGDVRLYSGEPGLAAQLRLPLAPALAATPRPKSAYAASVSRADAMSATTALQSPGVG